MAKISTRALLLLLACAAAAAGVVRAIHDPAYGGIKTKTYRRDPIIAQALERQHEQHTGRNHEATANFDANERLSASPYNQHNQHNHNNIQYQQSLPLPQQQQQQQQQGAYYQPQEVPLYQRNYQERHAAVQQAASSGWEDAENAITEYYTGCPTHHTGQLPYAYDCRRFLNCWHGRGHIQSCAPGTVFNPDTLECDRPEKVVCGSLLALGDAQATKRTARYRTAHRQSMANDNVELLCPPGGDGLHPHPTDCSKFLNCANGNVHVQSCGPGTAYSIPLKVCDHQHKVDCSSRGASAGSTLDNSYNTAGVRNTYARNNHGFTLVDLLCPANVTGLFPHPFDYTKFLNCKSGNTAIQNCMPGMIFSISKRHCDTKETVPSTDHVSYIVSEVRYEYSQRLTSCPPGTDGQHLYPFDCARYLKCANGQMTVLECAPAEVFSISRGSCLQEQHVFAGDRVRYFTEIFEEISATFSTQSAHSAQMHSHSQAHMLQCPRGIGGPFPFPFDASKYLTCDVHGKLLIETCSSGSVFSLSRKQCHLREDVTRNDMLQVQVNYEEQLSQQGAYGYNSYGRHLLYLVCPAHLNGYFVHPFDCTRYIQCRNGETKVELCGSGTVYSISRELCISRDQVEAFDRVEYLTETQNEFSTEMDQNYRETRDGILVQCPPHSNDLHSHPHDTSKYLRCTQGRTVVENCPSGMMFSNSRRSCDYENGAGSNDRNTYGRNNAWTTDTYQNQGTTTLTTYPQFRDNNDISCPVGVSGMYPHTRDCSKYLNCVNGATQVESCGPDSAWDARMQVCAPKRNVNCAGRSYSSSSSWSSSASASSSAQLPNDFEAYAQHITCPSYINGYYPDAFDYTKYIICQDGRTVVQKCHDGKAFSMSNKKCLLLAEVDVSDRVRESWADTDVVRPHNSAGYILCPTGATGSYIYPFDCTKFIKCENGQTRVESCVQGKIFSLSKQWCTLRTQVRRADRVGFLNETQSVYSWESQYGRGSGDILCPTGVSGFYQHPYNWTQYLNCVNGRTFIESCPSGKVFSISRRVCESERRVAASDRCNNGVALIRYDDEYSHRTASVSRAPVRHRQAGTCAPNESGIKPHPTDCTKFLNCANGVTNVQDCGPGTAWNIEMQVCDFLNRVDCSDRGGASARTDSIATRRREFNSEDSESSSVKCPAGASGIYAHPLDCTKFLNCANGITYVQACGPGTAWSAALQVCDFIANVDCSTSRHEWFAKDEYSNDNRGGKSYVGAGARHNQWGHETGTSEGSWSHHQQAQGQLRPTDMQPPTYSNPNYYPQPQPQDPYTQTQGTGARDRWSNMNVPRPNAYGQGAAVGNTWSDNQQRPPNTGQYDAPDSGWSGTGSSMHRVQPSQNVHYEEGSLQPNRNYARTTTTLSTPLAPFASDTGAGSNTNLYYAQPVGTQEDSEETFNSGTYGRVDTTYARAPANSARNQFHSRQNTGRETNYQTSTNSWNPNSRQHNPETYSPLPTPNQNIMPPRQDDSYLQSSQQGTAFHMTHSSQYPNQQLMPPYREDTDDTNAFSHRQGSITSTHTNALSSPNQNLMPPRQDDSQFKSHQHQHIPHSFPTPNQQFTPPYRDDTEAFLQRQGARTHTNVVPVPNQNLMPPRQDDPQYLSQQQTTASHITQSFPTPNQQLMPPYRDNTDTFPHRPGTITHTNVHAMRAPSTHLMPPLSADIGQERLEESTFGLASVIMDSSNSGQYDISGDDDHLFPTSSQITNNIIRSPPPASSNAYSGTYTQRNFNQRAITPTASNSASQPTVSDESNLFGGLLPPLPTSPEPHATTPQTYLQPPTHPTPPVHSDQAEHTTARVPNNDFPILNASVKKFVRDPHYSASYAGVAHSRNASWELATKKSTDATRNTGIKGVDGPSNPLTAASNNDFSDVTPTYRSLSPPSNTREYHARTTATTANRFNEGTTVDGKELPIGDALLMLLRPYFNRSGTISGNTAVQAESYIMNLASTTTTPRSTTTTTKKSKSETTQVPVPDVELILAGEQRSLATPQELDTELYENKENSSTDAKPNWHNHEHSADFHRRHPHLPNPFTTGEQANVRPDAVHNSHSHKHHPHHHHHRHHEHSREFHLKHPKLPDPFATREGDKSIAEADIYELPDPNAETATDSNIDLRSASVDRDCQFDCGNGKCIKTFEICDGVNNCGNRNDESNCDHLGYEVRLTGGESTNMGRIEVKILGKWGYVCDDKFGLRDADVVCRELGFKLGASEVRGNSYYPPTEVNFSYTMDEVDCRGNETALKDCDFPGWGVNNCGPDELVGVVCKVPLLKCPNNYWLCSTSKECIPPAFVCDNTPDCADGSDESERVCNSTIEYRLEGGRSANEGRLEVKFRGEWGTVCDDDFGLKEAQVACNSLGYYGAPTIEKNIFGPGSGPIWLDQVSCVGNESAIGQCHHWTWGEHNCNHTEDVGVRCTAGPPPRTLLQTVSERSAADERQAAAEGQLALEDIGLYPGQLERSSKFLSTQRRCGHFKRDLLDEFEHPEERVVNGTVAKRGRHPWQATIRTRGRGGISSHWCGAVLISKKHLLTAAHCLSGYPKGAYFIRMGDHYANIAESSEVDSYIENWYIHEKFRDKTHMNNDIALIVLKNPVRFNDYIQPICLPEKGTPLKEQRLCTISGWGSIKSGVSTPSNILRAAQLPILADATCMQSHVYGSTMTEGMFCAGFMDESVDACDGDSGGPLVCSDDDGETLYGIISWGQHCGYANKPGVYVRVEKYIDWIYEKINFSMQQSRS